MRALFGALCVWVFSIALAGCLEQRSFLRNGDATSAEIMYSGDVAHALPIAKQHCAGYGRVPRLADTAPGVAYFACDQP
jgi:hypothetical protein